MNDETPRPRRSRGLTVPLVVLALVALAGWRGWAWWQARALQADDAVAVAEQRLDALEQRVATLRDEQRKQTQRLHDAAATNRVLRDEVLGLGQRGALLEDSVAKLSDPDRHGAQALRLDEVELLLSQASQRLDIARDVDGARRAYALAAGVLDGVDDYRMLNLKQVLAQERTALDALQRQPQSRRAAELDAFASTLAVLHARPARDATAPATRPVWQRALAPLVDIRASRDTTLIAPSERTAAEAALHIELALARAALERDDDAAFAGALARVDAWMLRLWPDSPALRQGRAQLKALRAAPGRTEEPVLGSTLQQLRALRVAGVQATTQSDAQEPGDTDLETRP